MVAIVCDVCVIHEQHSSALADMNADCGCECIDEEEEDIPIDTNREGDPAFNGAFDRW